jgi:hypothetical protein
MNSKEIVRLHPDDEAKLHPVALQRLLDWGEKLSKEIPLFTLSFENAERWLSKNELAEWQEEVEKIREWLAECLDDEFSIYCHSDWVTRHMMEIEKLIERVWQRKSRWVQEQQKWKEAERKSLEYARELNNQVESFKGKLSQRKRKIQFPKDPRYLGYTFVHLLPQDKKKSCEVAARKWIETMIPESLRPFLSYKYMLSYRLVPCAEYSLENGIPCLSIGFDVFIAIEALFWLKPNRVTINGYEFTMPEEECSVRIPEGKVVASYFRKLTEPQLIGYHYRLLTSDELDELGYYFWQTIPSILIQGLMQGNLEPGGCTIIGVHQGWTIYTVDGFEDEIAIPDTFCKYLKEIGSWQGLLERGIISSKVGEVVTRAIERSAKGRSSPETPKLIAGNYEEILEGLRSLGWKKTEAEEKAKYVMKKYPDASLEEQIRHALAN